MNNKLSQHCNALHIISSPTFKKILSTISISILTYRINVTDVYLIYCNYCAGLQALHEITTSESYKLRVDLEDWEGNQAYAEYS